MIVRNLVLDLFMSLAVVLAVAVPFWCYLDAIERQEIERSATLDCDDIVPAGMTAETCGTDSECECLTGYPVDLWYREARENDLPH